MIRTGSTETMVATVALLLTAPVAVPAWGADPSPTSGSFTQTGSLSEARTDQTATLLLDGRVLVVGGDDYRSPLASTELWDPSTGSFSPAGSLIQARKWHTATLQRDGRVLVIGGLADNAGNAEDFLASAELWDPSTEAFGPTGSLAETRIDHTATLLADGRVLVVGGVRVSIVPQPTAEVWDPATASFDEAGVLADPRSYHTATLLDDGRVLVVGGLTFTRDGAEVHSSAELWDPATGSFGPTGSLAEARMFHTATLLHDGRVLVVGGSTFTRDGEEVHSSVHSSAELWDPDTGTFTPAGSLIEARSDHTATLLPDGRVLIVGGGTFPAEGSAIPSAELWDPATSAFSLAGSLAQGRDSHTATVMPDGRVLVVGGDDGSGRVLASAELWAP